MKAATPIGSGGPIGFLLLVLTLLFATGAHARAMVAECGDVLDIDHGQYRLNGDLECPFNPSFAAVTITGEGVHFNLAGHTITRDDDTGGFLTAGILVRGANAHINGGSIIGIDCPRLNDPDCAGIFLGEAPGVRINGMTLHDNTIGIVSFSFGPVVGNADGARIHGNDITGNLRVGIALSGFGGATAEGAKITGNDLSDTGGFPGPAFGYVGSTDGVSVIGNVANNCGVGGILLFGNEAEGFSERNTIRGNTTLNNGNLGISLGAFEERFRPRNNRIEGNTSFGNGVFDLSEAGPPPIGPFAECLNRWKDNDFDVAAPDCIE